MASDGWEYRTLGELTDNFDFKRVPVKEADRRSGPYPYYGASGIVDHVDEYLFDGEYLLIAEDGENLRTRSTPVAFLARGRFWVNNHAHIVRGNHRANTKFLMYALAGTDVSGYLTGSTMPKLTQGNMNRIPVIAPPLADQEKIAENLGSLDDKIDLNRRMNETLESMARAIFKSWFVDFDPVRAKMEGRQPVGMDAETARLFPHSFKDSQIGKVPSGWEVHSWGDLVTLEYGKSLRGYEDSTGDFVVFGTNGPIGHHTESLCPHAGIIVGRKGAYRGIHYHHEPFFVIDTAFYVKPCRPIELRFAYYQMLREDLNNMDSGSAIPSTSRDELYGMPVVAPPLSLQRRFVELLNPHWLRQIQNLKECGTLSKIRDELLPRLLSGVVRVAEIEGTAERSL